MAKKRRKGESISGYFRPFFIEKPSLLTAKSNEELIERWKQDHPNYKAKSLQKVRQNLSNLKSLLRRQQREKTRTQRKGAPGVPGVAVVAETEGAPSALLSLEDRIDNAMYLAWRIDRTGLATVIQHLRLARNEVVATNPIGTRD